ncbi:bifunctional homocysteine S-methyltransferase/5,10-methylenetetrahydrofolate reductase [mine drainage metagenome]|uniref:Bifunctional homocysteine S-methyltransferase/5,10-methylenetetrahydrofolate reductase n=1 Tax=mine drainage metagenome TaxID=410659 RepID=A0A1J5PB21_9ZZZZ
MSRLSELVSDGLSTIFTAEFPSIDGGGMAVVAKHSARLLPWFDAVNATDNPAAHAHASSLAVSIAMKSHGLEPIMQVVCRDKNRLAIQADIVGASLHGIENICLLTGDDVTAGDEPETKRVFDIDGPQAIHVASALASGKYLSGRKLDPAPKLFIGAVENPAAPPFDYRISRVSKKVEAGATFLQLQIGYHPERLEQFCTGVNRAHPSLALLPTIVLVKGARPMNFMNEKVPGIDIPAETIRRIESSSDQPEAAYLLALEQAKHALEQPGVRGLHITDFRHDESIDRLMSDLGRVRR